MKFLLVTIVSAVLLAGCDARQQLEDSRARRDAAFRQYMSPAEAQDMLGFAHDHDAAFDQSMRVQSQSYNQPYVAPSTSTCPACEQGVQQGQAMARAGSSTPAQQSPYVSSTPSNYSGSGFGNNGVGEGAVGWDGRRYIPVDPALTPDLTPDGYAK